MYITPCIAHTEIHAHQSSTLALHVRIIIHIRIHCAKYQPQLKGEMQQNSVCKNVVKIAAGFNHGMPGIYQ